LKFVLPEDKLILRPKPLKTIILALVCLAFTTGGILISLEEEWKGWLIASFFGLGLLVFIVQLIPGSSQLTLTKEGFIVTSLFRSYFTEWSDIEPFEVGYVGKSKFVKFDYKANHKKHKTGKGIAKFLTGNHGALPSNYGMSLEDLSGLMNTWKSATQLEK